jgi:hypothetical protein
MLWLSPKTWDATFGSKKSHEEQTSDEEVVERK